jgi:hypothetical protein
MNSVTYFRSYDYWEETLGKHSVFQLLITDAEIFNQYKKDTCDTIRKYVPILHHYQLTLEDLQRMNWTIVYPPEE